ncbi:MAG: hypothetical protein HYS26_03285 [Candidatus Kaiserbacteria bacterium]|nr:MAG: hypothetical protein HYS26_03285 [Candidatus Kaiserbacteria bacterium]
MGSSERFDRRAPQESERDISERHLLGLQNTRTLESHGLSLAVPSAEALAQKRAQVVADLKALSKGPDTEAECNQTFDNLEYFIAQAGNGVAEDGGEKDEHHTATTFESINAIIDALNARYGRGDNLPPQM